jgi:putative aldouronate transport system permease protein
MKKHRRKRFDSAYVLIAAALTFWGLVILYPFYNSVVVSFVTNAEYIRTPFMLWPKTFTLDAYKFIFEGKMIFSGYRSTLTLVALGVPFSLAMVTLTAYAMSRKRFPGKKAINLIIVFTMFFSGGLIPFYLLIRSLNLTDSLLGLVVMSGVSTYYMIIMRKFFENIPESLVESAYIDGANDFVVLARIMVPLSAPIIATLTLFFTVDRWNEWFNAMIFLRSSGKWPLQLVLRSIVHSSVDSVGSQNSYLRRTIFAEGVKMASVVATMLPIMVLYPFLQKYFVKGIMLGAVKS